MGAPKPCTRCTKPYFPLRRGYCHGCYMHQRLLFGWEVTTTDAQPARDHVVALQERGVGLRRLSEITGVSRSVLQTLVIGKTRNGVREPPSKTIAKHNEAKILAVEIPDHHALKTVVAEGARVPAIGTLRRVRSLIAFGYTQTALATYIGWTIGNFNHQLVRHPTKSVNASTARKVQEMFDVLQLTPGQADRSRRLAARKGWVVPFAYDELDMDAPAPDAGYVQDATSARRRRTNFVDSYLELRDHVGLNDLQIAARLGIQLDSLYQQKLRHSTELAAMESLEGIAI